MTVREKMMEKTDAMLAAVEAMIAENERIIAETDRVIATLRSPDPMVELSRPEARIFYGDK